MNNIDAFESVDDFVQSEAFRAILNATASNAYWKSDVALYAPLVFAGKKTGALTSVRNMEPDEVKDLFERAGFVCKVTWRKTTTPESCGVYYTRDESALAELDVDAEDAAFGRFLGVPEEDNRWMDASDMPDTVSSIPEYLGLSFSDVPQIQYARLVSWVCKPTEERLDATIDIGREWYKFAVMLEEETGYSGARNFVEYRMTRFHSWYTVVDTTPSWYEFALPFRTRLKRYIGNLVS